jgi:hypothetical protein
MPREIIKIANPMPGGRSFTSAARAALYVQTDAAYMLPDGRLQFRAACQAKRQRSDTYVDARGTIFWNGARSQYVDGKDVAMFPPCCNVVFPKTGTKRAAERYA